MKWIMLLLLVSCTECIEYDKKPNCYMTMEYYFILDMPRIIERCENKCIRWKK